MNKITEGPWEVKKYDHHWTVRAPYISDGEPIGTFELCRLSGNREEAYNDARLMAAAPEMYGLLERALGYIGVLAKKTEYGFLSNIANDIFALFARIYSVNEEDIDEEETEFGEEVTQ